MADTPKLRTAVCVRFPPADLEMLEVGRSIVGDANLSQFIRMATLTITRAIIQAEADRRAQLAPGDERPNAGWQGSRLELEVQRKP